MHYSQAGLDLMPAPPVPEQHPDDSNATMERAITRAAAEELPSVAAMEMEYAATAEPPKRKAVPKLKTVALLAMTAAAQAKAKTDAGALHGKAQQSAEAQRKASRVMQDAKARNKKKRSKSKDRQPLGCRSIGSIGSNLCAVMMLLLMIAGMWGPAAYSVGRAAGIHAAVDVSGGYYAPDSLLMDVPPMDAWMSDNRLAYDWNPRESCCAERQKMYHEATAPGQCTYEVANPTATTTQPDDGFRVPNTPVFAKDNFQHKESFARHAIFPTWSPAPLECQPIWHAMFVAVRAWRTLCCCVTTVIVVITCTVFRRRWTTCPLVLGAVPNASSPHDFDSPV